MNNLLSEDELHSYLGDVYYSEYAGTVEVRQARIQSLLNYLEKKLLKSGWKKPASTPPTDRILSIKRYLESQYGDCQKYCNQHEYVAQEIYNLLEQPIREEERENSIKALTNYLEKYPEE